MAKRIGLSLLTCVFLFSGIAFSQEIKDEKDNKVTINTTDNGKAGTSASDESMKSVVRYSLLGGTVPVIFLFGVKAWDWQEDHSFYSH
ncbi:MAG TPA: hypothetical protein VF857_02190, partial [Spirochaetota bacterium]